MTLTFEHDLDRVEMSQLAKCLDQRSCPSKVIAQTRTDTHTRPAAQPGPLEWHGDSITRCVHAQRSVQPSVRQTCFDWQL